MLELCWNGTKPIVLKDGTQRSFVQDGDTLIMRAFCKKKGLRIGFGECVTKILPAV
jgi:fumarylacetoacetase